MSDDFDFDLDLTPRKNNINVNSNNENQSPKKKLSLMDKLAQIKNAKINIFDDLIDKSKLIKDPEKENHIQLESKKEKETTKNIQNDNVSNLQKMLSKIKSNNDSLKRQSSILNSGIIKKETFNNLYEESPKRDNEIKNNYYLNKNDSERTIDNKKNDSGDKKNLDEINSLLKNNDKKSNLNFSESIEEIDDIIELPEMNEIQSKKESIKNISEKVDKIIPINKEIVKALDKINSLNINKKDKPSELKENKKEDSLEILISESNINEIELIEEKNNQQNINLNSIQKNNISENTLNGNINYGRLEEVKCSKELNISKGSFDMDTDEEIENKNKEKQMKANHDYKENKTSEERKSSNNSELLQNLLNSNIKNNENINPIKKNNVNDKSPFQARDSNLSDSRKLDDFNISQNLVNLSKEIQEYKSSSDVNNQINNIDSFRGNKNSKPYIQNDPKVSLNIIKNDLPQIESNKINTYNNIKNSITDKRENIFQASPSSKKKLNDSILGGNESFAINDIIKENINEANNKIEKNSEEIKANENKNIKDLFKLMVDDDDEEEFLTRNINNNINDMKELGNGNLEKNKSENDLNSRVSNHLQNQTIAEKQDVEPEKNNDNSIIDIDDIPEIEDNDEEDSHIVNLDKKAENIKKSIEIKSENNNFFNNNKPNEIKEISINQKNIEEKKNEKKNTEVNKHDINNSKINNNNNNKIDKIKEVSKKEEEKAKNKDPPKITTKGKLLFKSLIII